MGASASKASRSAASKASHRVYPTSSSGATRVQRPIPQAKASQAMEDASQSEALLANQGVERPASSLGELLEIEDKSDPTYANRLQSLGIVSPNPFFPLTSQPSQAPPLKTHQNIPQPPAPPGNSLANNMFKRRQAQALAREKELEQGGDVRTEFLSAERIVEALQLRRKDGVKDADVEERLKLKPGVLAKLGQEGVVDAIVR